MLFHCHVNYDKKKKTQTKLTPKRIGSTMAVLKLVGTVPVRSDKYSANYHLIIYLYLLFCKRNLKIILSHKKNKQNTSQRDQTTANFNFTAK